MPTILQIFGWRLHFFANEGNEPIHIHCTKDDMECKFWLDRDRFDITEAFGYNLTSKERRIVYRWSFGNRKYS